MISVVGYNPVQLSDHDFGSEFPSMMALANGQQPGSNDPKPTETSVSDAPTPPLGNNVGDSATSDEDRTQTYSLTHGGTLDDNRSVINGQEQHDFSLELPLDTPTGLGVHPNLEPGPNRRYNVENVTNIRFHANTYSNDDRNDVSAGLIFETENGRFSISGDDEPYRPHIDWPLNEDAAIAIKRAVDAAGGLDAFTARLDLSLADAAEHGFEIPQERLQTLKSRLTDAYRWGEQAEQFSQPDYRPANAAEQVVVNAQALEQDPTKLNALLDRLGTQFGIPGGARPWTEWLDDSNEVPVANAILQTAARFPDVTPADLSTIIFGEGAGFFVIAPELGNDYRSFNSQPQNGFAYWGLDTFADMAPELKRRGYLPSDFKFEVSQHQNERGQQVRTGVFNSFEDTVLAAGAVWQYSCDQANEMMKSTFGRLPQNAQTRFFYTYALFNAGPEVAQRMMNARGADYVPQWNGTSLPGNSQENAVYNATVRVMQREFFNQSGVFRTP